MNQDSLKILNGDALQMLKTIGDETVQCCVTSPPYYGLRNYGAEGQIGNETTPEQYIASLVSVFREVRRTLTDNGTLWLNLGDTYAANRTYQVASTKGGAKHSPAQGKQTANTVPEGLKPKDLLMIPARVALALQADGWYLRAVCPWIKRNAMPESCKDRPTTTIESIFLLTKSAEYYYDSESIKIASKTSMKPRDKAKEGWHEGCGTGNCQSGERVWGDNKFRARRSSDWFIESWQGLLQDEADGPLAFVVNTKPYKGAHFACFPPDLIKPCILAGSKVDDIILDPFGGSGTTGQVALSLNRKATLIELNPEYIPLIKERCEIQL